MSDGDASTEPAPMTDHLFYASILRFVAQRADRTDGQVAAMMDELSAAADEVAEHGKVTVAGDRLALAARAFAGIAGFLQTRILPETIAHGNAAGERQVRWAVDSSMEAMNLLLSVAATGAADPVDVRFPALQVG